MKFISKKIFWVAAIGITFAACKKDEARITTVGGTSPVLTSSVASGDTLPLVPADSSKTAVSFSWTNPNYSFSDGISSQNVTYYLEVDTLGANFNSSKKQQVAINSSLDTAFTTTQFNTLLGNGLQVSFGQPHNIQVRLVAFIAPNINGDPLALPLYSNLFNYTVTAYAPPPKLTPPAEGTLYIVGSATPGGWDNPIDLVAPASQQFTQISNTEYTITLPLTGGGEYKLIAVNGSWSEQWSVSAADTYPNGGPFVSNGANNIAPPTSGTYTIDVNFQTGIFTVTPQ
jgi:hypothetical protein